MKYNLEPLCNAAEVFSGFAFKSEWFEDEGTKVIRIGDIEDEKVNPNSCVLVNSSKYKIPSYCITQEFDILMALSGATTGKIGIVAQDLSGALVNQRIAIIRANNNITQRYLRYIFSGKLLEQLLSHAWGAAQANLSPKALRELMIPLPPLNEQKRIAAILDKADEIRRKRKEAIRLTDELLRSVFLDMFGDPVINPKGWEVVELGSQVAELRYGTSVKCLDNYEDETLPVLRIPNIVGSKINWEDLKYVHLEKKEIEKLRLKAGDILFVRTNGNPEYIGRCALFEAKFGEAIYASYLIRARLKEESKILPDFLRDIVSFPTYRHRLVQEARTTAGNYNISTAGLSRLKLICPSIKLQQDYINIGYKASNSICNYRLHYLESNSLFNALMQRAFKGEL